MKKLTAATLATGLLTSTFAFAQINSGDALGTSEADIRAALEAQGYVIDEVEIEGDEIEVDAVLDGVEFEIEVSAETGLVTEVEMDDEDDDEEDDEDSSDEG